MPQAVLGSWKEIAQFMGKGVRTVQRWEHELKLPVHRPSGARKGVVIAFPEELEKWARHQETNGISHINHAELHCIRERTAILLERFEALRHNLEKVQLQTRKAWLSAARGRKDPVDRFGQNQNGGPLTSN